MKLELNARIDTLEAELGGKIEAQSGKIEGMNGKIEGVNSKIEGVNSKIEGVKFTINAVLVGVTIIIAFFGLPHVARILGKREREYASQEQSWAAAY